ncbi:MAG: hypothetical protein QGG53_44325 [Planctomycetota bacterium]|jgi:hypothetical protein|nr:hypothetical protein [Planctomycetota bacterium]
MHGGEKWLLIVCAFGMLAGDSPAETRPTEGYLARFSRRVKAPGRGRIALRINFPRMPGVDRLPATFGVPFPRGALQSSDNVRMVNGGGQEVPCAIRRTASWMGPDGDVRWILVDAPIRRGEKYFLEYGTEVTRADVKKRLAVDDAEDRIVVNTGPLELAFSKHASVLIAEAKLLGRTLLSPTTQKRMHLVDEAGEVALTSDDPGDYQISVEQNGPLHAIVKGTGWYRRRSGEKLCQYITRLHAYAGEPFIRIVHTFVVAYDTDKVRLKDICIPFVLDSKGNARSSFGIDASDFSKHRKMGDGYLLQHKHNAFVLRSADGQELAKGEHAPGWFDVSTEQAGLTVGLRHLWQEYPKEQEAIGNEMRVHLWPPHRTKPLDFDAKAQLGPERYGQWSRIWHQTLYEGGLDKYDQAMGLAKTNELVLSFRTGGLSHPPPAAISRCMTLEDPLVVSADPDWMCESDVFGRMCSRKSSSRPDVERKIEASYASFDQFRREREGYGMIHYGDIHGKGPDKGWRHWASRFYGSPLMPWIMFVRTGEPRYLTLAMDSAKHVMDIDMCHVTNLKYGDYGRRCPKSPGKRKGGRYGGDGGIIHYAGHLYDLGCDSHIDQWTYAYYLTGYRRAWDILHEEGEFYIQLDKEKLCSPLRRYDTRMTGGALRTFTTLYRATWDERYLALARRAAEHYYTGTEPDGTSNSRTLYDGSDVYMTPGMFTYYQATGDERMRSRFLKCLRKLVDSRKPVYDGRLFSYYGPAMAYFVTGDTTYLNQSVGWMNDFLPSQDGTGGHPLLTVHVNYLPYILGALAECEKPVEPATVPVATDSEFLLRRDDQAPFSIKARWICYEPIYLTGRAFSDWPEYCRRNGISARLVVRDAGLRTVASSDIDLPKEAPGQDRVAGGHSGDLVISVPAGPPGVYSVAVETSQPVPMRLFLLETSLKKAVYPTGPSCVSYGGRHYFKVPAGSRKYGMKVKAQILRTVLRLQVFDPNGRRALDWKKEVGSNTVGEYEPLEWDVPTGADGKIWSFTAVPTDKLGGLYIEFDGPSWLSASNDAFFVPKGKLQSRVSLTKPDPLSPAAGKALNIPAGKALTVSCGDRMANGNYERLPESEGTIEFRLRPGWTSDEIRDIQFLRCGELFVYRRGSIGTYLYVDARGNQSGFVMMPDCWYHVAIAWNADEKEKEKTVFRMYVNGISLGSLGTADNWAGPVIRIGAEVPLDIADLRVSDVARYKKNFDVIPARPRDRRTLAQIDFAEPLPSFAEIK